MPLRQLSNRKRYLLPLTIFLYAMILIILLIWIERLEPNQPAETTQISFNKEGGTLNITGENLPSNFSAILTPNMQREHDTLSSRFTWGRAFNIAGINNHLWVANKPGEILSYNIINPKKPALTGVFSFNDDFKVWNITIENDRALIAGGASGLACIDIANPSTPVHKFTIYKNEVILDSIIKDDTAIIVSSKKGLLLLDIKDDTPKKIGRISLEGKLRSITQDANRAYILGIKDNKGLLYIVDITQPRQAKHIATIELPHPGFQCKKVGDELYISMGRNGLYIDNIYTLNQKVNSYRIEEITAFGLCTSGQDVFISNGSHHIHHYQIENNRFTHIKTFLTAGKCQNTIIFNHYLIACLGEKGFAIFDPSKKNTTPPPTINSKKRYGITSSIPQRGKHFFIASRYELDLFTTSENGAMSQYESITFTSGITSITMDDRYAYVALVNNEIHIITLAPITLKRTEKVITWSARAQNIVVSRSKLFIGSQTTGISVLNVDDLNTSQQITPLISIPHSCYAIEEDRLYVATRPNGLKIYQLDDETIPVQIGEIKYPATVEESSYSRDIKIKNGYAFITSNDRGLLSVDVRDPKNPIIGDALDLSGFCGRLTVHRNYAYVTTNNNSTTVVDVSDPLKMKTLCVLPTITAVSFTEKKIYQLNDIGMYINPLPKPLKITKQSTSLMEFELPSKATEGYYDLQLASTQQLATHSDLLHYSQLQGWTMTREPTLQ